MHAFHFLLLLLLSLLVLATTAATFAGVEAFNDLFRGQAAASMLFMHENATSREHCPPCIAQ